MLEVDIDPIYAIKLTEEGYLSVRFYCLSPEGYYPPCFRETLLGEESRFTFLAAEKMIEWMYEDKWFWDELPKNSCPETVQICASKHQIPLPLELHHF